MPTLQRVQARSAKLVHEQANRLSQRHHFGRSESATVQTASGVRPSAWPTSYQEHTPTHAMAYQTLERSRDVAQMDQVFDNQDISSV
jgi:hypothetical protein